MAELLFAAVGRTNPNLDSDTDQAANPKRGDLIDVQDNGFNWGKDELLPPAQGGLFCRVIISDVTRAQVFNFAQNKWGRLPLPLKTSTYASWFGIKIGTLPNSVLNQLNNNGVYTNDWATIRQYVKDKISGSDATGDPIE